MSVQEQNRELAHEINEEALNNPKSSYAGKFVGIVDGKVEIVADNLDEVARALSKFLPDSQRTLCIEAGVDYTEAQEIWSSF
jgi:hypothetical protein